MTIYHTSGIRRYLKRDSVYTTHLSLIFPSPLIPINTKTLLKSLKRKEK